MLRSQSVNARKHEHEHDCACERLYPVGVCFDANAGLFLRSPFHRAFIVSLQTTLTSRMPYIVRGQRTGA